jgi:hypothetical protein
MKLIYMFLLIFSGKHSECGDEGKVQLAETDAWKSEIMKHLSQYALGKPGLMNVGKVLSLISL